MLFNSFSFLVFFALVLLLHRLPLSWSLKKFNLVAASYLFYAAWNPPFVVLLWISTAVDWMIGRRIHEAEEPRQRRRLLLVSLS
ncbi:MAG: MBOAT family protein, partial [Deltaproteobacteria bacterium]|nr:MBOAT family protein [Deltaproteobacteria bacterium]